MKTILITGASSGMGKAMAKELLNGDHKIYVAARRLEKMNDLKELGATPLAMDITDEEDVKRVVNVIDQETEGIDILINNAGFGLYGAVEDVPIEKARYQFDVNLFGLAHLTQFVLPGMRKKGKGKIINISSMGGEIYTPLGAWYHASKHALEAWSDCLRLELDPFGIDVVIIQPGIIKTEFAEVLVDQIKETSMNGPYSEMAQAISKATQDSYTSDGGSPPELIAKIVKKVVNSDNPKTRYAGGKLAKPLMWARHLLSDRLFDRLVMSQVKSRS
ncbi:MAG: oxidoreductase [Saprospiraceae bacterium]|nr:oxidoreductase [Saprospiraceae bacterium]